MGRVSGVRMAEEMVVVRGRGSEEEEEGECSVVVVVVVVVFWILPGPRKRHDRLFNKFGRRKVQELLFEVHLLIKYERPSRQRW